MKQINLLKWTKNLNRHLSKDIHVASVNKQHSTPPIIWKMQIRNTGRYYFKPVSNTIIKNDESSLSEHDI